MALASKRANHVQGPFSVLLFGFFSPRTLISEEHDNVRLNP
jgi:hypothetical protein